MGSPIWHRRHAAFTLIELLVVVAIIAVLAGMLLPMAVMARESARQGRCKGHMKDLHDGCEVYLVSHGGTRWIPLWLTQLADLGGLGRLLDASDRKPSDPSYDKDSMLDALRDTPLICPSDGTMGEDGGRPDTLSWSDGSGSATQVDQYLRADVDPHAPSAPLPESVSDAELEGTYDPIPCSYLYEFNSELCDWVHDYHTPPTQNEFAGVAWGGWDNFVRICDQNGDKLVSWYEIKQRTISGWKPVNLKPFGVTKVPFIRCYWHVRGFLLCNSKVLSVRRDGSADVGTPEWYKDE